MRGPSHAAGSSFGLGCRVWNRTDRPSSYAGSQYGLPASRASVNCCHIWVSCGEPTQSAPWVRSARLAAEDRASSPTKADSPPNAPRLSPNATS